VNLTRHALSLDALTIGFARRFATYKRANLIMQDLAALASLINDPQMVKDYVLNAYIPAAGGTSSDASRF